MPATPDVLDDDDLDPWSGALEARLRDRGRARRPETFEEVARRGRPDRALAAGPRRADRRAAALARAHRRASPAAWRPPAPTGRARRCAAWRSTGARLGGLQLVEATAEDVVFRDCRLELATFRGAKLRNVLFERCILDEADFLAATLQAVRFEGCRLLRADFTSATLTRVDLRGSDLDPVGDVGGLRGAIDRLDPARRPRPAARARGGDQGRRRRCGVPAGAGRSALHRRHELVDLAELATAGPGDLFGGGRLELSSPRGLLAAPIVEPNSLMLKFDPLAIFAFACSVAALTPMCSESLTRDRRRSRVVLSAAPWIPGDRRHPTVDRAERLVFALDLPHRREQADGTMCSRIIPADDGAACTCRRRRRSSRPRAAE